jgi:hypothetical protein
LDQLLREMQEPLEKKTTEVCGIQTELGGISRMIKVQKNTVAWHSYFTPAGYDTLRTMHYDGAFIL